MVNKADLPRISWEEDFGPQEADRVSGEIVAAISGNLPTPAAGFERLYFIVPTPAPYTRAEAEFLAAAAKEGSTPQNVRVVALSHGGKCYVFGTEGLFKALLPNAFRMGPPELTLIAANCSLDLASSESDIAGFVLAALKDDPAGLAGDMAGIHFDSGDLVEVFGTGS